MKVVFQKTIWQIFLLKNLPLGKFVKFSDILIAILD